MAREFIFHVALRLMEDVPDKASQSEDTTADVLANATGMFDAGYGDDILYVSFRYSLEDLMKAGKKTLWCKPMIIFEGQFPVATVRLETDPAAMYTRHIHRQLSIHILLASS